jgi:hypothetical protein
VPRRRRSITFSVEYLDDDALPDGVGILDFAVFAYRYDAHAVAAVETMACASDGVGVGGYHLSFSKTDVYIYVSEYICAHARARTR